MGARARAIVKCGGALAGTALFICLVGPAVPVVSAAPATITPRQAVREALAGVRIGSPNQMIGTTGPRVDGLTQTTSANWGGYADDNSTGNTYTAVSASWIQPTVTTCGPEDFVVFWVGIDGFNNNAVEQDGTLATCSGSTVEYEDWWEMFPTNSIQFVNTIAAGDLITSKVAFSDGQYHLTVTDHTNPSASFTKTETCQADCTNSSAEWIGERPGNGAFYARLPDFGTWRVTGAKATSASTEGTISSFPDDAITMKDDAGHTLESVSSLNSAGTVFTAKWRRLT
jgi:hypothetical protein